MNWIGHPSFPALTRLKRAIKAAALRPISLRPRAKAPWRLLFPLLLLTCVPAVLSSFSALSAFAEDKPQSPAAAAPVTAPAAAAAPIKKPSASQLVLNSLAPDPMYKGELSMLGMTHFASQRNFVGASFGYQAIDSVKYLAITPLVDLYFLNQKLKVNLGATLNLTIFNPNAGGFSGAGRPRAQDWDEWQDYFKIIRNIQFGNKEDRLYLRLSSIGAATMGHGTLMRRYNNNMLANRTSLGFEADAYNDYAGGEFFLSDITLQSQLVGVLAFLKPLSFSMKSPIARSFSVGLSYVGDQKAPNSLVRDDVKVILMDRYLNPQINTAALHGVGFNAEVKPLRIGDNIDVKTYFDFSSLIGYGQGFSFGALGRFNFGAKRALMAVRARLEYSILHDQFIPSYFDNFYEIQKLQMVRGEPSSYAPTKLQYLQSLPKGVGHNLYSEITFSVVDWLALSIAYEVGSGKIQQNLLLHAEFTATKWLKLFATYHKRNFQKSSELFKFEQNDLLFAQARLTVLPILFLNGRASKTFLWDPSVDKGLGGLRNVWDYRVDVEIGWQWN